jgi:hypothetical protein
MTRREVATSQFNHLRNGVFKCNFSIHKLTILHTGPVYECPLTLKVRYPVCDLQQK